MECPDIICYVEGHFVLVYTNTGNLAINMCNICMISLEITLEHWALSSASVVVVVFTPLSVLCILCDYQ